MSRNTWLRRWAKATGSIRKRLSIAYATTAAQNSFTTMQAAIWQLIKLYCGNSRSSPKIPSFGKEVRRLGEGGKGTTNQAVNRSEDVELRLRFGRASIAHARPHPPPIS